LVGVVDEEDELSFTIGSHPAGDGAVERRVELRLDVRLVCQSADNACQR
jgi:hypothetical protein